MKSNDNFPQGSIVMPVRLKYEGGVFDENMSELYDGVTSLDGFSKMIHIVTHAYINEEVIRQATALKGARIYRRASKPGSFVEVINVVLEHPLETMTAKMVYDGFYDFLKYSGSKVVGKVVEAKTRRVKKLVKREPFISSLCDSMRKPVKEMHRPIKKNNNVTIGVGKERSMLINYDYQSLGFLQNELLLEMEYGLLCNVTKMNALSPHGRLYLDELGRTVAYEADETLSFAEGLMLSKSLDDTKNETGNKICVDVRKLVDGEGKIIKVYVYSVK
ncbi:hypothetical protein SAMN05216571_1076 [Onishia taeanensis]|uniref:DUF7946 domain-containing protein n=1 Tax=Onishia taeanensis TaxID=284577 RepID=A0A1G7SL91_9GAMM|nr:hypothetical protein [Halomonas taeanensis]SDG23748.1 hypothetical protein SAMN05216571_1076 [Halomonas taeanensis]